jgi:hypothetical protein
MRIPAGTPLAMRAAAIGERVEIAAAVVAHAMRHGGAGSPTGSPAAVHRAWRSAAPEETHDLERHRHEFAAPIRVEPRKRQRGRVGLLDGQCVKTQASHGVRIVAPLTRNPASPDRYRQRHRPQQAAARDRVV